MHSGDSDAGAHAGLVCTAALLAFLAAVPSCMRDPLDPRGDLARRAVGEIEWAERQARGREAYGRSRLRAERVRPGMSIASVEVAMGAFIAVEMGDEDDDEFQLPRQKLMEGFLCSVMPSRLRKRWLFGYDEDGVELIGFAMEFERDDPETERWRLRLVDREPNDDCEQA